MIKKPSVLLVAPGLEARIDLTGQTLLVGQNTVLDLEHQAKEIMFIMEKVER